MSATTGNPASGEEPFEGERDDPLPETISHDHPQIRVTHRGPVMFAVMAAMVMQTLDMTIANVALPHMQASLSATQDSVNWILTSYVLASAVTLPLTGWLARRFGERKLFMWSTLGFVFASFLCGLAHSMGLLVMARALQGLLAGPMYPVTQALLLSIYPPAKRGHAIEPGWIVLTGGMTDAYFATPGTSISCHFTNLGSVRINGGE